MGVNITLFAVVLGTITGVPELVLDGTLIGIEFGTETPDEGGIIDGGGGGGGVLETGEDDVMSDDTG